MKLTRYGHHRYHGPKKLFVDKTPSVICDEDGSIKLSVERVRGEAKNAYYDYDVGISPEDFRSIINKASGHADAYENSPYREILKEFEHQRVNARYSSSTPHTSTSTSAAPVTPKITLAFTRGK